MSFEEWLDKTSKEDDRALFLWLIALFVVGLGPLTLFTVALKMGWI